MSSYLVFSLREKESGKFRDVTAYISSSDQYQTVYDALNVPYNGEDNDTDPAKRLRLTKERVDTIKRYIKEEREGYERSLDAYRQTNNPSWDLFTTAQDYIKFLENLKYIDIWCDALANIVYDIDNSESFYEGLYIHIDN